MSTAVVVGAGGDLGAALCSALRSAGHRVVALGRGAPHADEIVHAELTDPAALTSAIERIGAIDVLVYNAGRLDLASLADTSAEAFLTSWQVNAYGAFLCAKAAAPGMIARGRGAMVFIGATGSTRGGARTHAFASSKHALRGLASSLAKELGPRGIHVAHLVIDGKIWGARTRERFPDVREDACLRAESVARTAVLLTEQSPDAWTYEIDLRPHTEKWS